MLVAGTVSGNQSFARVVLSAKNKEEADEYRVGQKLGDLKIIRIDAHSITLGRATSSFKVEVGETIQDAMNRLPKSDIPEPPKEGAAISHKPTIFSRTDVDRILKNPIIIYEKARFAPNIENGKISFQYYYGETAFKKILPGGGQMDAETKYWRFKRPLYFII